jgi:large subunit ribosomal protein L22
LFPGKPSFPLIQFDSNVLVDCFTAQQDEYHHAHGAMPLQSSFKAYSSEATPSSINPLQQMPSPKPSSNQTQSPSNNIARAILRGVAISPRKLNDFVRILPGLHMEDALIQCRIHHKKSARICERVLLSARANATTNHGLDAARLCVSQAWVGKGQYLKRVSIHGRGRSGVLHKKRSHLTIILREADEPVPRRTRVIPMMQERKKMWNIREGKKFDKPAPWSWWPKRRTGFENGFGSTRRESKSRENQLA